MAERAINKKRTAIIGVGYVGASIAYALTLRGIADEIVLIDAFYEKSRGEAADISHGIPFMGNPNVFVGSYSDIADCDLIIITAGRNRRKGESRSDLVFENIRMLKQIASEVSQHYTRGVILVVTNPVDAATYKFEQWMGLPLGRVFGTGCVLDTSRLTSAVSKYAGLTIDNIRALVIGEHGDTQVPVWSRLFIAGITIAEYCGEMGLAWDDEQKKVLAERVRNMGASIILDKERTHYGIATCVSYIASAVLSNHKAVVPVSSTLQGEYGISDIALSVPSIIGSKGIEKRIVERLEPLEFDALHVSAKHLLEVQKHIMKM